MKFSRILLFLACFIGLILLQREVVIPFVFDVAKSDLFLTDSDDLGDPYVISTPMTDIAFMQCNHYITEELPEDLHLIFPDKPENAWNIGDHTYVINAEIEISKNDATPMFKKYVCRISYNNKGDDAGAGNYENWSVYGLSGLEDL